MTKVSRTARKSCLVTEELKSRRVFATYQRRFTKQFTAFDKISYRHVEECVSTTPVGDLSEGESLENLLKAKKIRE